ncbi:hypothetical protein AB0K00_21355 [Dactylosporangium sp. NPDC049525]|uniref:hypothetical protein n=1 Tax=Dactylosporangium sp. NPDC049525 TaxID=3154730 RepID=UPI0034310757
MSPAPAANPSPNCCANSPGAPGGSAWQVLLWLHSPDRERHLHQRLADLGPLGTPVATAARAPGAHSTTGPWRLHSHPRAVALADLPYRRHTTVKTTFSLTDLRGLMPRDRWAIDMLTEHRALTTDQFTALACDSAPADADRRLQILAQRRRPVRIDLAWLLGPFVVHLCRPVPGEPDLTTNQSFADLAAHARTQAGTDIRAWRSIPAPYGQYLHNGKDIGFWYQRDAGGPPSSWPCHRSLAVNTGASLLLVTTDDLDRFGRNSGGLTIAASRPGEHAWHVRGERLALYELPEAEQVDPSVHPIHDPQRPYDEAVADGVSSYVRP